MQIKRRPTVRVLVRQTDRADKQTEWR